MNPINDISDPTNWVNDSEKHDLERHKTERAANGYSVYDFWNFFAYNSWVMIQALEDFKTGMGHPVYGEVQTMDDWVRVLTEIQDGFKAQNRMADFAGVAPGDPEWEELEAKWKRGMELLTIYYGSLWD